MDDNMEYLPFQVSPLDVKIESYFQPNLGSLFLFGWNTKEADTLSYPSINVMSSLL